MTDETNRYDVVPYGQLAFAQTHPDRLATMARIFGLAPPAVSTCRVLELGCASGANLIPMAFNLPDATFVGVDLSRRQVQSALGTIEALGLRNIQIRHASILDVDPQWGQFDYIICHGVFSWVETAVQDRIFRIAVENLAPDGVAYVSYNVYPGWHIREMVRHMMRYHAGHFDEPPEQIEQARALLDFLTSAADPSGPYGQLLGLEVERLKKAPDSYLFHEHLEQTNSPLYFHQFIERAERAGLMYLSEASIGDMLSSLFQPPVAETLERISPDIVHLEQYMDFVRNRQFRQTLLVHASVKPRRALTPAFLHGLLVSSPAVTKAAPDDLSASSSSLFTNGTQQATVSLPASRAAMLTLMETWPRAIGVDELCAIALERAAAFVDSVDDARRALMGDLFGTVMHGMVLLHTQQLSCTNRLSDRPRAHPLTAGQAHSSTLVVNAHHEMVQLDALGRELVLLADGTRGRAELLDALVARIASGALQLQHRDERISDLEVARVLLESEVPTVLASLVRSGALIT